MTNLFRTTPLLLALIVAGCADPADDKYKATASAPQPVPTETKSAATPAAGVPFVAADSKIEFIGSKVTGTHHGGFKSFSGTAELASDKPELTGLSVEIDTDSLWSDNEKLTGHLKSPDFFDVAKFPKATFIATEIKPRGDKGASNTITGNLTLHGETKSISFPATVKVEDGVATLTSEFAINRKDFGIKYEGKSDDLIRDEVVIKLDVKTAKKS